MLRLALSSCALGVVALWCGALASAEEAAPALALDPQSLLEARTFWDNRDWSWYRANIPFFECPDADINTTYYYRWELLTKHLTYGSPATGYVFTEFIDRPFWSGTYGAISCPSGHQLYEARWLRQPRIARDYARYWFRTPGAQPRRYSCWLAAAVWAVHQVHPDKALVVDLLADLIKNYEGWERERFDADVGLFWQTGHDDGMEININSRQTTDTVRGAPAFRPTLNSYLWADALAIARVADLAGDSDVAREYRDKAAKLKQNLQAKLWDPRRQFFFPMSQRDEVREGFTVNAGALTYQTGKYAGNDHGREQIGYVPWQFGLPDAGYEPAWKFLMDPDYFYAEFGPTVTERNDPQFLISPTCCVWSGQSWPYATTQTLQAMARLLHDYKQNAVTRMDYLKLLTVYAKTHRKDGKPYLAEAANPDTGSWEGHDSYNHSEHYFHSGFADLVITGLAGLRVGDDDTLEVDPLAPADWDYFALDDVPYRGHVVGLFWDKTGARYGAGPGLRLVVDGRIVASSAQLVRLTAKMPPLPEKASAVPAVNLAVNNDGQYYPKITASYSNPRMPLYKLIDGNYWYHPTPPNRWTCEGSLNASDWLTVEFGTKRTIDTVKLYVLDDGGENAIRTPERIELELWNGSEWTQPRALERSPEAPSSHRANIFSFKPTATERVRVTLTHRGKTRAGLSEVEAWGGARQSTEPAPAPKEDLAYNPGDRPFPKVSASHTSSFDKVERATNGRINYAANPPDRWTSYGSSSATDWLQVDFGAAQKVGRVELAIYNDGGGVQAPADYRIQFWHDGAWRDAAEQVKSPAVPTGGQLNEVRFPSVETSRLRVLFKHQGNAKSGVSELFVFPQ